MWCLEELEPRTSIHCPYHDDQDPSAFVVQSQQGVKGVYCLTCAATFWPEPPTYDFYEFEERAREARAYFDKHHDMGPLLNGPDAIPGLERCTVEIVQDRPTPPGLQPGLTLIKSPERIWEDRQFTRPPVP